MTIAVRLENRADVQPARGAMRQSRYLLHTEGQARPASRQRLALAELAFRIFAAFRAHPHINNVLTHISRAKWGEVEHSLNRILDVSTTSESLSPLEENIIDLLVGERGVTGRIMKPYFHAAMHGLLEPHDADRLIRHVNALYLELEWKAQHPPVAPLQSNSSEESGHASGKQQ